MGDGMDPLLQSAVWTSAGADRSHLWAIEHRFDWGAALLWSGWDTSHNGPNGDLLPILFRTRRAAREWIRANNVRPARPVRVRIEVAP
jgi:hypothetical protein